MAIRDLNIDMSKTEIPGMAATHAIITNECRENHGDEGALDEAIRRLRESYDGAVKGWKDHDVNFHVVLTVERKS